MTSTTIMSKVNIPERPDLPTTRMEIPLSLTPSPSPMNSASHEAFTLLSKLPPELRQHIFDSVSQPQRSITIHCWHIVNTAKPLMIEPVQLPNLLRVSLRVPSEHAENLQAVKSSPFSQVLTWAEPCHGLQHIVFESVRFLGISIIRTLFNLQTFASPKIPFLPENWYHLYSTVRDY